MKNSHRCFKQPFVAILAIFIALCFSFFALRIPVAYAAEEPQATETAETQPTEETAPQPTEETTPQPTEETTPQPTEETTPQPTEEPQENESSEPVQIVEVDGAQCVDGEVIVKFKDEVSDAAVQDTLESVDSEVQQELPIDDLLVTEVPEGESVESFIDTLEDQPNVEYVQPNFVYQLDATVNDPYTYSQWHLGKIDVYDAWNITMGSPDVRVAVIDTGIDLDHPDFYGQIYAQTDVVDNDGSADDDHGHGTHVAGIIAASANNGIGVAGIAPNVKLIVVDAFSPDGAYTSDIIKGIDYAISKGADIINMSLGSYENDTAFKVALDSAVGHGVVCVAAAGNENTSAACYPSDYDSVISVIATTSSDTKASFSNYGSAKDISAPGEYIVSTCINGGYANMSGTSMASPVVAGVVALILSAYPNLTVTQVKNILYSSSLDLGSAGKDDTYGCGRVDAYAAVQLAKTESESSTAPLVSAAAAGYSSIRISWNAVSGMSGYQVYRATSENGAFSLIKTTSSLGYTNTSLKTGTTYYYKVRAYRMAGRTKVYGDYSAVVSDTPFLQPVSTASVAATSPTKVKVSWSSVSGRTRYEVWRSENGGAYTLIGTTTKTYYSSTSLTPFKTYSYYIRVYRTVSGQKIYAAAESPAASAAPVLNDVTNVRVALSKITSIKLAWSSVSGASGYEVLRWDEIQSKYVLLGSTTRTYYSNTGLIPNQSYRYQVRAYCKAGTERVYSTLSSAVTAMPVFGSVTNPKAARYNSTKVKLTWSAVSGRSGYEIYRSASADGEFVSIGTTTKTYFYSSGLTTGTQYYYKIRAYVTVNGERQYSGYSTVVTATP